MAFETHSKPLTSSSICAFLQNQKGKWTRQWRAQITIQLQIMCKCNDNFNCWLLAQHQKTRSCTINRFRFSLFLVFSLSIALSTYVGHRLSVWWDEDKDKEVTLSSIRRSPTRRLCSSHMCWRRRGRDGGTLTPFPLTITLHAFPFPLQMQLWCTVCRKIN